MGDSYDNDDDDNDGSDWEISPALFALNILSHVLFVCILDMTGFVSGLVYARCKLYRKYSKRIKELEAALEEQSTSRAVAESIISSGTALAPIQVNTCATLKVPL